MKSRSDSASESQMFGQDSSGGRSERNGGRAAYNAKGSERGKRNEETSNYAVERANRSVHQDAGRSAAAKEGITSHRVQRVEREIRDVVGSYLISGFRGDLPGIVSITRVICSKDLRTSKIFVTVMGLSLDTNDGEVIRDAAIEELQAHAFEVQREINVRLRMRHCPRVSFIYDEGFDNVMKVERILRELEEDRVKRTQQDIRAEREATAAGEFAAGTAETLPDKGS